MPRRIEEQGSQEATVVSVERALRVLEEITEAADGIGTREISRRLGFGAGSTQKLINTLRGSRYIEKRPDSDAYTVGPQAFRLAYRIREHFQLVAIARPVLLELAEATRETIFLGVREMTICRYVDKITSSQMTRVDLPIGLPRPLNCTGVGKVLLAFDPTVDRSQLEEMYLSGVFTKPTDAAIAEPRQLSAELALIRKQGFALDRREYNPTAACVAAPVRDRSGAAIAAISLSGPAERIEAGLDGFIEHVVQAGKRLSHALGSNTVPPSEP